MMVTRHHILAVAWLVLALVLASCGSGLATIFRYQAQGEAVSVNGVTLRPLEVISMPTTTPACPKKLLAVMFSLEMPVERTLALYELEGIVKDHHFETRTDLFALQQPGRPEVRSANPAAGPKPIGDGVRVEKQPLVVYHRVRLPDQPRVGVVFVDYELDAGKPLSVRMERVGFEGEEPTWSYSFEGIQLAREDATRYGPEPCGSSFWPLVQGQPVAQARSTALPSP